MTRTAGREITKRLICCVANVTLIIQVKEKQKLSPNMLMRLPRLASHANVGANRNIPIITVNNPPTPHSYTHTHTHT